MIYILEARQTQLRQLLDKASSSKTSSKHTQRIFNTTYSIEMLRQEQNNHTATSVVIGKGVMIDILENQYGK
jgi:hypothetical protein